MKKILIIFLTAFLLAASSIEAQNTSGMDFWVTFGRNRDKSYPSVNLQIRIVGGDVLTKGVIKFTALGNSAPFSIEAQQVYTYNLSEAEKQAVYNTTMGVSDRSIHITADNPVTVYALNQALVTTDATNVLPRTVLGTDYYQISYQPFRLYTYEYLDAYAVIATKDNTNIYHNGGNLVATLNTGQVYYRTSDTDMTGVHITANNPVAFFAVNQGVQIPANYETSDCLMQQLAPVNTWGKNFLVPVSHLSHDIVRIVASQDNTIITQTGGALLYPEGGQTGYTIQAGQFIELEVFLYNNGCYIQANKPIGVCAYLTSRTYSGGNVSDPAQAWLSSMEQTITNALIAPFIPVGTTALTKHYALIVTETLTRNKTEVSIGGASPVALGGGIWRDNAASGMSFYNMPLTNETESYYFTNDSGLIVMCYGIGDAESYYYLGSASMCDLFAAFAANGISYQEMSNHLFCEDEITFAANVEGISPNPGSLNWYIDDVHQPALTDLLTWSRSFAIGNYAIKMTVLFGDGTSDTYEATLRIGAAISAVAIPAAGGTVSGDGCYEPGEIANLIATPNLGYDFVNWTDENGDEISDQLSISFTVTVSRTLTANFLGKSQTIVLLANPPENGTVTGEGVYPYGETITVHAIPIEGYSLANWTEDDAEVSRDADYSFTVERNRTLTANFTIATYDITLLANPPEGGEVYGAGNYLHNHLLSIRAVAKDGYQFVNWTENDIEVSKNAEYSFTVVQSHTLVANFEKKLYEVIALIDDDEHGFTKGSGMYEAYSTAYVEAVTDCYRFKYWTINDEEVSTSNPYEFIVKGNVTLVAHTYALDFDLYSPTLWNNTFMLDLKRLREEGYEVIGCKWYKNGVEETDTRTINEFSYSAGPEIFDLLESDPTYYMFRLITKNYGELCSTLKIIDYDDSSPNYGMWAHPNPVRAGVPFVVKGVAKDDEIRIYNQYGVCVHSAIADRETIILTLNVETGVYVVRANGKRVKVVIIK